VGHDDEAPRRPRHQALARQGAAAALDEPELVVDLVGAVDGEVELVGLAGLDDGDAELAGEGEGGARGRDADDAQAGGDADGERALAKMDRGAYGTSEASGDPIPYARLRAVPWARVDADEDEVSGRR